MIDGILKFFEFMRSIWLYWMLFWGGIIALNFYLGYKEKKRKPGARIK